MTRIFFTHAAITGDVVVLVSGCDASGHPDHNQVIARVTMPRSSILVGSVTGGALGYNKELLASSVTLPPTFLASGQRYAATFITSADHTVALTRKASQILQGSFYHSGDPGHVYDARGLDLKMRLYFAKFADTHLEVDMQPLQLPGGMTSIEVLTEAIVPAATEITYQVQIGGLWKSFAEGDQSPDFSSLPALCPFKAVLTGTTDLMPGISLTPSEVTVSSHKTTLHHVSKVIDLGSASDHIKIVARVEDYIEANHNLDCTLLVDTGTTDNPTGEEAADVTDDVTLANGTLERAWTFNVTGIESFKVVLDGVVEAGDSFHVSKATQYAL